MNSICSLSQLSPIKRSSVKTMNSTFNKSQFEIKHEKKFDYANNLNISHNSNITLSKRNEQNTTFKDFDHYLIKEKSQNIHGISGLITSENASINIQSQILNHEEEISEFSSYLEKFQKENVK